MDIDKIEKAYKLLEELKELKRYSNLEKSNGIHFEIRTGYLDCGSRKRILIPPRYNRRFLLLLKEIMKEMEEKLRLL